MKTAKSAFKAYDIRGQVPEELNEEMAYKIGRAFCSLLQAKRVVVGRDNRLSSPNLAEAVIRGILESGADVIDIGMCGTEMVYFSTNHYRTDGGIMITASHNPINYNGMKLVKRGAQPISGDSGLRVIEQLVLADSFEAPSLMHGQRKYEEPMQAYVEHLLSYVACDKLRPFKIVVNAGNGCAGAVIDALETKLPFAFVKMNHYPDGTFPHGIPNPLLSENREMTARLVKEQHADFGIAWDGDYDRCFLFDEKGEFVEGYYMVGLLAEAFLKKEPGVKIIHDPRLTWNTIDIVSKGGGTPVQSKTGHAFIKERMRAEDAIYGGEMSAHHYFREFAYCDSGMIPWLLIAAILSEKERPLSEMLEKRTELYPVSGEINSRVSDAQKILQEICERYAGKALSVDYTDGISIEYEHWRFNVRLSNTEPLLRLNIETMGNKELLKEKTEELLSIIRK